MPLAPPTRMVGFFYDKLPDMTTLNAPDRDIATDFGIATGLEDIRQRCLQRMRFFRGEWFMDIRDGTPWFTRILTRPVDIGVVNAVITEQLASVEGVQRVESVDAEIDRETRTLRFEATLITNEGSTTINDEVSA